MPPSRRGLLGTSISTALGTAFLPGLARSATATPPPGVSPTPLPRLTGNHRVIIDTDPGNDDAVAILMGLSAPNLTIEAITVTPGNIGYAQEVRNALYVVDLAGQSGKIPVHAGAHGPILGRAYSHANFIHGKYGLGAVEVPVVRQKPDPEPACDAIRRIVRRHPGEVVIAALGGLTNIAITLLADPSLAHLIKGVVFVGGTRATAYPTFNAMVDPEAADIVVRSGVPLVMFENMFQGDPTDPSLLTHADFEHIQSFNTPYSRFFMQSNALRLKYEIEARGAVGSVNADPFAMSIIIDPAVAQSYKAVAMRVDTQSDLTRGVMVYGDNRYNGQPTPPPNVNLCTKGSNAAFKNIVFRTLAQR